MATDTSCPIIVSDGPGNMVWMAYDKYSQFASNAYTLAYQQTQGLQNFTLTPIAVTTHWNLDATAYGFNRPQRPDLPPIVYNDPGTLPAPPDTPVAPISFDAAPADPNAPVPTFVDYTPPAPMTAQAPAPLAPFAPVTIPAAPSLDIPPLPTLQQLNLPDAPDITIPPFSGVRPSNTLAAPVDTWSFSPTQYASDLLTKAGNTVSTMLDGGTGLPPCVDNALRERANVEADAQQARDEQEAFEDFTSRGFSQPNGLLAKRLDSVRQQAANRRNSLNRDIYIQEQKVAIDNLRFAVQEGIALESKLIDAHSEEMRLALSAAQLARETAIQLFDAQVRLFNTEMQAYQIDAQVWRSQIEGELATLQEYEAKLRGQALIGQINRDALEAYSARVRALSVASEMYRATMMGVEAQARANTATAEAYRANVQGYAEEVRAYEAQWSAYVQQMATNDTRARVYATVEQGFATRIHAWDAGNQAKIAQQGANIQVADLKLRAWHGQLDALQARVQAERDRVGALTAISAQQVDLYRADVGVETAASDANLRALSATIEQERARTAVELQNAQMQITQMEQISAQLLEAKKTIATVSAQLAASSMSAVNFSAGTHSSLGQSYGCSTSFNYSGSLDTTS